MKNGETLGVLTLAAMVAFCRRGNDSSGNIGEEK